MIEFFAWQELKSDHKRTIFIGRDGCSFKGSLSPF